MKPITKNTLFYGDNLQILREYIPDESIDLIYLDPPFNSNRNYNVLFKEESGNESEAQITAFEDTWHWDETARESFEELVTKSPEQVSRMISALHDFIGQNQIMAYLVMMTIRLLELHRVLKETGSLYLHCDPTASHYLKIVMDTVFGKENFRNEIAWCYTGPSRATVNFPKKHDVILFYAKSDHSPFYFDKVRIPYSEESLSRMTRNVIKKGGTIFNEVKLNINGKVPEDWWTDIVPSSRRPGEHIGYPTQKPIALLERIINASSKEGDWVFDPFAGCGTTIAAAEKLNRKWIGIDITHLAISLLKYRLRDMKQDVESRNGVNYEVIGEPKDLSGARQLAQDDRYQFQWWANGLIEAMPLGGQIGSKKGKKGADKGVDGVINFIEDDTRKVQRIIIQVNSGTVGAKDIRDLIGTLESEKAVIGVFITLENLTYPMIQAAGSAGHYLSKTRNKKYSKIQILTIEQLLEGAKVDMPPQKTTFKKAKQEKKKGLGQSEISEIDDIQA